MAVADLLFVDDPALGPFRWNQVHAESLPDRPLDI